MPPTEVVFYQESSGETPVLNSLLELRRINLGAYAKCAAAILRLARFGHELRRPTADYLEDGIYELRIRGGTVHFRILYFFHGRQTAVLGHALAKEDRVPRADLARALARKRRFESDPTAHTSERTIE